MSRGDVARSCCDGGQPVENPPSSFLTAEGTRPWSRASSPAMTASLPSRANTSPVFAPVPGGALGSPTLHRHHLVEKVCTFEAPCPEFAGQGDLCPEIGETEAETADKVCLELCKKPRVKYTNNFPQLPPAQSSSCSCLQLREELICTGSYPGEQKHRAWGLPTPSINPSCPRGLSVPGQAGFRGPTATSQPRRRRAEECRGRASVAR